MALHRVSFRDWSCTRSETNLHSHLLLSRAWNWLIHIHYYFYLPVEDRWNFGKTGEKCEIFVARRESLKFWENRWRNIFWVVATRSWWLYTCLSAMLRSLIPSTVSFRRIAQLNDDIWYLTFTKLTVLNESLSLRTMHFNDERGNRCRSHSSDYTIKILNFCIYFLPMPF